MKDNKKKTSNFVIREKNCLQYSIVWPNFRLLILINQRKRVFFLFYCMLVM